MRVYIFLLYHFSRICSSDGAEIHSFSFYYLFITRNWQANWDIKDKAKVSFGQVSQTSELHTFLPAQPRKKEIPQRKLISINDCKGLHLISIQLFFVLSGLFLVYLPVYKEDQWSPTLKYFWDETLNTKRKVLFKALPWLCIQWCNYRLDENNRFVVLFNVQYYNKKSC